MPENNTDRRRFLKGAAGLVGLGLIQACAPAAPATAPAASPTAAAAAATAPAAAPSATTAAAAMAQATPTTAVAAATPTIAAPAIKYADQAAIMRFMTGGFTTAGPDDDLIKQYQEEALRKEYGINVDIRVESASWADIDNLMDLRLQTQATDSVQRYDTRVLTWITTPGLIRDIDAEVKQYGKNLIDLLPAAAWQFFMREDQKYIAIPLLRATPHDIDFLHIRRDWLDKVNRDIPTTLEEFEECLRLFKEKQLGGAATIPYTNENPGWLPQGTFLGPFVGTPEEQIKTRAQGADHLYNHYAYDEARLEMFRRWYKDGLLNQEWTTWQYDQVYAAATKGMVGAISAGWWTMNGTLATQVMKADPTQDWVQVFPPLGRQGVANSGRVYAAAPMGRGLVVTTWAQAPEAIIVLADWENKSLDNFITCRMGLQGKHWKYDDTGALVDLRDPTNPEYSGIRYVTHTPARDLDMINLPPAKGQEPYDPAIAPTIYKNCWTRKVGTVPEAGEYPTMGGVDLWLPYKLTKSSKFAGDLDAMTFEGFTKIVNGDMPISQGITDYWAQWRAAGGDVRMAEMTDQWNQWIKDHPEWTDPKATFAPEAWRTTREYPERPTTA